MRHDQPWYHCGNWFTSTIAAVSITDVLKSFYGLASLVKSCSMLCCICLQLGSPIQLVVGNGDHATTVLAGRGDAGLTYSNNSVNPKIGEGAALTPAQQEASAPAAAITKCRQHYNGIRTAFGAAVMH
jgi:hypothetical protein